jgi:ubiquinone/menaquinone biosynthesis C-methylase UbiE
MCISIAAAIRPMNPGVPNAMSRQRNPQAEQMADESMLRTLTAQAEAIWPQEQMFLGRYGQPSRIADIGCGSGEITGRLAARYPQADIVGVDILESSAAYARRRYASLAPRVRFEQGDAFELKFPGDRFDLVVCRHMTQSVPEPEKVIAELYRICRPGGWIHVLSEDYGMLHMPAGAVDPDRLWYEGVVSYTHSTHTDARIGRRTWSIMNRLRLQELHVDYVIVDSLRVPRETFGTIIEAWRDGYTDVIAEHTLLTRDEVRALFDHIIGVILDPQQYAAWHIPVISGRKQPASANP